MALLRESLKSLRVETIDQVLEEHSVPYDSQSDGMVEIGVPTCAWQGQDLAIMSRISYWAPYSPETSFDGLVA